LSIEAYLLHDSSGSPQNLVLVWAFELEPGPVLARKEMGYGREGAKCSREQKRPPI